jgi:hypothetical protein
MKEKGKDQLVGLWIGGRIILEWIVEKWEGVDFIHVTYDRDLW